MNDSVRISEAIERFDIAVGKEFALKAFPGDRFRISACASYCCMGEMYLYTQILSNGEWIDFAKGTEEELRAEARTVNK